MIKSKKSVCENSFGGKHNNLFRPGPNWHLNACVGRNGGRADYLRYATGYFEFAKRGMASLQDDPLEVDLVVYPLVYNYRHGIELILKHLAHTLPFLCDEKAEAKLTHKLLDNWELIRKYLKKLDADEGELDRVEATLGNLVEIDENGETFRFPTDRKETVLHLQDTSLINVEVFAMQMEELAQFFTGCCDWAGALRDAKCEWLQEQRETEREMAEYYRGDDYY